MKPKLNEQGYLVVQTTSGTYELRPPKGRDLVAMEKAGQAEGASNFGLMMSLIALLCNDITIEQLEDMPAEDVVSLGEAVSTFPAFSSLRAK